jgi:two-component system sensor histidine kinase BarA
MLKVNGARARITLGVILILLVTLAPVAFFIINDARNVCLRRIEDKAAWTISHVADVIKEFPGENTVRIKKFIKDVCEDPDIAYCKVYGPAGYPIAEFGSEYLLGGEPAKKFEKKIIRDGYILGTVLLGVKMEGVFVRTRVAFYEVCILILFVLVVVGIIIRFFLDRFFVSPVVDLARIAADIGRKKFTEIPDSKRRDEIGDLQRAVGFASRRMRKFYNELEDKVAERTRDLELSNIQLRDEIVERSRVQAHLKATLEELSGVNRQLLKARDSAEQASRFKSRFMAMMSHEVRTPMNSIMGMTELLRESDLNFDQKYFVGNIVASSENLLKIIDDILGMVSLETSQVELASRKFDPVKLAGNICKKIEPPANSKEIELDFSFSADTPRSVLGDEERVGKILENVISNAVKFTSRGEVCVRLEVENIYRRWIRLLFIVKDTGIGIPEDKRGLIFDSFTQADNSTSREFGGTGLGLAIAAGLVNLMDGKIWFESQIDKGSIFYISLPLNLP